LKNSKENAFNAIMFFAGCGKSPKTR